MLIVLATVMSYIRVRWGHVLGVRMEFDMRADFFTHLQKLSFNYFDNVKTGHLMSRISNDLNQIAEVAHHAPEDLLISISLIIGAFTVMFHFNVALALIAIIPIPFLICWGIFYGGSMRRGFRRVRKKIADINSSVENSVQGIREVKSYANEEEEIGKFETVNVDFRLAKENMYGIMAIFFSVMSFLIESYFFVVIGGGVLLMHYGKGVTSGDLLAFILYIYFILNPIRRLVNFAEQFQQGAACFERFTEVMDIEPDITDRKGAHTFEPVAGAITFDNVSFQYSTSNELILKDITLEVPAHKTVAIVGESGAGKSSIVSLIPRFYEPEAGTICIDGHDIMDLKQKFLRENIGIVQQNVFLFDSTIRENIMYGNSQATREQLIDAAQKANI
ncbi:MAG: ABC transporter ATP-binding protein, partial [Planctomycetota bacterium]